MNRCHWVNLNNPLYVTYHDTDWGIPKHNDRDLFELLVLESFQAGLSWECVLNKRSDFKIAFDHFDIKKIAAYNDKKCQELYQNPNIIRHSGKIKATVINAIVFKQIQDEWKTFDAYIWHFTQGKIIYEPYHNHITSPLSDTISKDLKKRGMKFLGSTTIYSYLQAIGIINGHGKECCKFQKN